MGSEAKQAVMDKAEAEKRENILLLNQDTGNSESEDMFDQLKIANTEIVGDSGLADGHEQQLENQLEITTPAPNEMNETQLANNNEELGSPVYSRIENVSTKSPGEAESKRKNQALPGKKLMRRKVVKKPAAKKRFSGYYVYMRERRLALGDTNPEMSSADVTRTLAKEWSGMDQKTKQTYMNIAAADKLQYEQTMADNRGAKDDEDERPKKKIMKNLKAQPVVPREEESSSGVSCVKDKGSETKQAVMDKAEKRENILLINQDTGNSESEDMVDQLKIASIEIVGGSGLAEGHEQQFENQLETTTPAPKEINQTQLANNNEELGSPVYSRIENVSTKSPGEAESKRKIQALPGKKLMRRKVVKKPAAKKRFSGYYVYMRERRLALGDTNPEMSSADVTRTLAKEWSGMDQKTKQTYKNIAAADKLQYEQTMADNRSAKDDKDKPPKKKIMKNLKAQPVVPRDEESSSGVSSDESDAEHIPIFSEAFLRHNNARESELKALRDGVRLNNERNATLKTIVEKRTADIAQVEIEMKQEKVAQETLKKNLNYLRSKLVSRLSKIPLPGKSEPPTLETIDDYMNQLKTMKDAIADSTNASTSAIVRFVEAATNAIGQLEL